MHYAKRWNKIFFNRLRLLTLAEFLMTSHVIGFLIPPPQKKTLVWIHQSRAISLGTKLCVAAQGIGTSTPMAAAL